MTYIENNLSLLAKKEKNTTTMAGFKYAFENFRSSKWYDYMERNV